MCVSVYLYLFLFLHTIDLDFYHLRAHFMYHIFLVLASHLHYITLVFKI